MAKPAIRQSPALIPLASLVKKTPKPAEVIKGTASGELVFGIVGPIGSGTSVVAEQIKKKLEKFEFDAVIVKARNVIEGWASSNGKTLAAKSKSGRHVVNLQDLGDEIRRLEQSGIAVGIVSEIRSIRAMRTGVERVAGQAVKPESKKRAYIVDALRHPAEIELLRHVYQSAFVLLGVVCEEDERVRRIRSKFTNIGDDDIASMMARDSKAKEKHGQRVADTFFLSDFFVDNSASMYGVDLQGREDKRRPNKDWDVPVQLERLIQLLLHSRVVRPNSHEFAMYTAHAAQMRSACLSRQVGAALVDRAGNVIATGTNEVPKAGGGVYGDSDAEDPYGAHQDHRCAFTDLVPEKERYCSNNREQSNIVAEIVNGFRGSVLPLVNEKIEKPDEAFVVAICDALKNVLRESRISGLLEFSRAVHAEMDALLAAMRSGTPATGGKMYVTTYPCHYCARHLVAAGIDEIQYIEPYIKSRAVRLHSDSITTELAGWVAPSRANRVTDGMPIPKVLIRPFRGVAPRLYARAFLKDVELKTPDGIMQVQQHPWMDSWRGRSEGYPDLEARLTAMIEQK